ncbi:MAG: OPT/YSL family transporter, partial [Planctomycetota bacterium]
LERDEALAAERTLPIGRLLALFFGSIVFAVVLFAFLVPGFPWWFIAPVALLWSFLFSLIDMRAKGTTGFRVDPPHVREGLILLSPYTRPDIWFAPWPISLGSAQWTEDFKVCELVGCTPRSYIGAAVVGTLVGMVANLLFMQIFWSIAPIPSAQYPYAAKILPAWVTQVCLWMSTTLPGPTGVTAGSHLAAAEMASVFNPWWMLYTGLAFTAIFIVGKIFPKLELSLIGIAVGMVTPIPVAVSLLIGVGIARGIEWKAGKGWFDQHRYIIVAGLSVGEGVVVGLVACVAALRNALVALPY